MNMQYKTPGERYKDYSKKVHFVFIPALLVFLISTAINTGNNPYLYYVSLLTLFLSVATGIEAIILFILSKIFH